MRPRRGRKRASEPRRARHRDARAGAGRRRLDRKGTDLAAALEVAAAAIPPFYVPRIVLISDGNPTAGDAFKAAAALQGKVEVSTVAAARSAPTPRSSSRP